MFALLVNFRIICFASVSQLLFMLTRFGVEFYITQFSVGKSWCGFIDKYFINVKLVLYLLQGYLYLLRLDVIFGVLNK